MLGQNTRHTKHANNSSGRRIQVGFTLEKLWGDALSCQISLHTNDLTVSWSVCL